ncbi:PDZ domain-containing protein 11-like isoform X2 [Gigantopelta aegis]|uniref:PDZ domain-containing protein 11-like isoform X2 n=1 Tax=Gigantopelta aegis TaxID=1735272 RepID=UPI001B88B4C1|nr:PDZ domain-containing protein 11-like isoform X2 [Gigantopelta aegis]
MDSLRTGILQTRMDHLDYNNDVRDFLPRKVILIRHKASEALGFNIRGGKEHHCGVYVSKVMPNSEADRLGLKEGDQILMVNDFSFEVIEHAEAVRVLKMNTTTQMIVRYFPYGYEQTYDKNRFSTAANPR